MPNVKLTGRRSGEAAEGTNSAAVGGPVERRVSHKAYVEWLFEHGISVDEWMALTDDEQFTFLLASRARAVTRDEPPEQWPSMIHESWSENIREAWRKYCASRFPGISP